MEAMPRKGLKRTGGLIFDNGAAAANTGRVDNFRPTAVQGGFDTALGKQLIRQGSIWVESKHLQGRAFHQFAHPHVFVIVMTGVAVHHRISTTVEASN